MPLLLFHQSFGQLPRVLLWENFLTSFFHYFYISYFLSTITYYKNIKRGSLREMVFLGATSSFVILTVDRLIIFSLDERILVNRSNEVRKEVDFNAVSVELPSFAMFPENTSKMRRRVLSLFRSFYLLSKRRRKREPSRERKKMKKKPDATCFVTLRKYLRNQ